MDKKYLFILGMLITGTINPTTKKIQNDSSAKGIDGTVHQYSHPWFQTLVMFFGELTCLAAFGVMRLHGGYGVTLPRDDMEKSSRPPRGRFHLLIFILPTCCDVLGTSFAGIGLLWVNASVWQMMRGSTIIFSGVLSVIFLKRKLYLHHWLGMIVTAGGLCLVGGSSFIGGQPQQGSDGRLLIVGLLFVLVGQLCNGAQVVIEEAFIKKRGYPPIQVVGMEGLWGVLIMSFLVLPVMYFVPGSTQGSYENSLDACVMLGNNGVLLAMTLAYFVSIAFYNFCALTVTKKLTAIHRTFIDALCIILVWGVNLFLYYVVDRDLGENWSVSSYVQLGGFAVLVFGAILYDGAIKLPCSGSEQATEREHETDALLSPTERSLNHSSS